MLQEFKSLPEPLQKQILIRLGLGAVFAVLLVAVVSTVRDIYLWLPCAGLMLFFLVTAILLLRRALLGDYVIIDGECVEVGVTTLKRRAKFLVLETEAGKIKVLMQNRRRKIAVGDGVKLYVAKNTPIYEHNGSQMIYTYIAIETT